MKDIFKINNIKKATSYDIYCNCVCYGSKVKNKDKQMLRQLARTKLKRNIVKEVDL